MTNTANPILPFLSSKVLLPSLGEFLVIKHIIELSSPGAWPKKKRFCYLLGLLAKIKV